jgi:hypothetical protein
VIKAALKGVRHESINLKKVKKIKYKDLRNLKKAGS